MADNDGLVACVTCGQRKPLATMDIVGMGYRCAPCSAKAEIKGLATGSAGIDAGAHFTGAERTKLRSSGLQMMMTGGAMIVGGLIVMAVFPKAGLALAIGGGATAATGAARRGAAG